MESGGGAAPWFVRQLHDVMWAGCVGLPSFYFLVCVCVGGVRAVGAAPWFVRQLRDVMWAGCVGQPSYESLGRVCWP